MLFTPQYFKSKSLNSVILHPFFRELDWYIPPCDCAVLRYIFTALNFHALPSTNWIEWIDWQWSRFATSDLMPSVVTMCGAVADNGSNWWSLCHSTLGNIGKGGRLLWFFSLRFLRRFCHSALIIDLLLSYGHPLSSSLRRCPLTSLRSWMNSSSASKSQAESLMVKTGWASPANGSVA